MDNKVDVVVEGNGASTVYLFRPLTNRACEWLSENVEEDAIWFGQAIAVEHRYVVDLVGGLIVDGLVVR